MDARLHLDELVAHDLMLDQVLAEGLALARPRDRLVEAGLREADRARRHAEPLGVEVAHDDAEAGVLLADQVAGRHAHIVEVQRRRVGAPPAHLLQRRAREPLALALDQQQRDAGRARPAGAHRDGVEIGAHAGGDEGLLAVDDIVAGVEPRGRRQVRHIRSAARLGDRQRADLLAREHGRQHARFQLRAAGARDRRRADLVREQAGMHAADAGERDLFGEDHVGEQVRGRAAVFLRESRCRAGPRRRPCGRARAEIPPPRPMRPRAARSRAARSGAWSRAAPHARR